MHPNDVATTAVTAIATGAAVTPPPSEPEAVTQLAQCSREEFLAQILLLSLKAEDQFLYEGHKGLRDSTNNLRDALTSKFLTPAMRTSAVNRARMSSQLLQLELKSFDRLLDQLDDIPDTAERAERYAVEIEAARKQTKRKE